MGTWSQQQEVRKETKERDKTRKEKLAGYFFEHRMKEFWNKRKVLFLWGINIGVILFSCYLTF